MISKAVRQNKIKPYLELLTSFAKSHQSRNHIIPRRVPVIEGLIAQPMGKRVDAKRGLLDKATAQNAGIDQPAFPVAPDATDDGREDPGHGNDREDVVAVLPHDEGVLVEVGDVGAADALRVLVEHHPAHVRVREALLDRVGVLVRVRVSVVGAVAAGPPPDRALDGAGAACGEVEFEDRGCLVGGMGP